MGAPSSLGWSFPDLGLQLRSSPAPLGMGRGSESPMDAGQEKEPGSSSDTDLPRACSQAFTPLLSAKSRHCVCAKSLQLCSTLCDPMDRSPLGSPCPWDFPGKNTGVGYHFLLQGIFPTQGLNPHLLCHRYWHGSFLIPETGGGSRLSSATLPQMHSV